MQQKFENEDESSVSNFTDNFEQSSFHCMEWRMTCNMWYRNLFKNKKLIETSQEDIQTNVFKKVSFEFRFESTVMQTLATSLYQVHLANTKHSVRQTRISSQMEIKDNWHPHRNNVASNFGEVKEILK